MNVSKLLVRAGAVGAVAAGTVWVIRKYQANKDQTEELLKEQVAKATEALQRGVAQVTELAKQAQVHLDVAATQFATSWLGEPVNEEPTEDEPEKPATDQYTHTSPLLDDER